MFVLSVMLRTGSRSILEAQQEADLVYQAFSSRTKQLAECLALRPAEVDEAGGRKVDDLVQNWGHLSCKLHIWILPRYFVHLPRSTGTACRFHWSLAMGYPAVVTCCSGDPLLPDNFQGSEAHLVTFHN
jgi:hypothetical protein